MTSGTAAAVAAVESDVTDSGWRDRLTNPQAL